MKRIAFVTIGNPSDRTLLSGTISFIYEAVSSRFQVVPVVISEPLWLKIILKTIGLYVANVNKKRFDARRSILYSYVLSKKVSRKLKQIDPDYVFAPFGASLIAFLQTNKKIIYLSDTTYKLILNYYPTFNNIPEWNTRQGDLIEQNALNKASVIIAASEWAKNSMLQDYHVKKESTYFFPLGANFSDWREIKVSEKNAKTIDKLNLLFIGVEWQRKGGDIVLDIYNILKKSVPVVLNVAGSAPPYEYKEQNVHFHGFLNKNKKEEYEKIKQLYTQSDFFILPTKAECAGIVFCESSAYGVPVLAFDTGGVSSYVENGVNGFLLHMDAKPDDFAKVISDTLKNKESLTALKRKTREKFEEALNWDKWLQNFNSVIN